ncbi:MAG: hypothetical protein NT130_02485 [Candidatus Micrarchaeota archaeon]|nr:hypothetical protein [Candidatus Micrarchaeota archaeon]
MVEKKVEEKPHKFSGDITTSFEGTSKAAKLPAIQKGPKETVVEKKTVGQKLKEKVESKVKTLEEQLKELREIAKDKIARSANYITAGVIACAAVGITATAGELLRLGLPQNALELAFAAGVALIGYGFGKAAGVHEMDEEIKNLEKAGSARIKEENQAAKKLKIQH